MDKAKVNGVEVAYEVTGSGEPVLLISTGPIADSFLPFLSEQAKRNILGENARKLFNLDPVFSDMKLAAREAPMP